MIVESKLKAGTLTLDALPFATQATNVRLVPSVEEEGEPLETLSGDEVGATETTTWALVIGAIQDFDDPAGFTRFLFDNAGQAVPFSWKPNTSSPTYSGSCTVRAAEIGGDVNTRLSAEVELPVVGTITPTYPA